MVAGGTWRRTASGGRAARTVAAGHTRTVPPRASARCPCRRRRAAPRAPPPGRQPGSRHTGWPGPGTPPAGPPAPSRPALCSRRSSTARPPLPSGRRNSFPPPLGRPGAWGVSPRYSRLANRWSHARETPAERSTARRLSRSISSRRTRASRSGVTGCRVGSGQGDRPHLRHRATADPARVRPLRTTWSAPHRGHRGRASRIPAGHAVKTTRPLPPTYPMLTVGMWADKRSAMPSRRREQQLPDRMWGRVKPLLPARTPNPKGGRPLADAKADSPASRSHCGTASGGTTCPVLPERRHLPAASPGLDGGRGLRQDVAARAGRASGRSRA